MFSMGDSGEVGMAREGANGHGRAINMKALLRLAAWGAAASIALVIAVLAATSQRGSQRLMAALSPSTPSQATAAAIPVARVLETEAETRRLAEAVRALDSHREQLLARIASLERNLEDVTGSIQRQAARAPAPEAKAPVTALTAPVAPEPPASAPASPIAAGSSNDATSAAEPEEEPSPPQGIDVGGAVSFDGLRALWNSTRTTHAGTVQGLKPLVVIRENTRNHGSELRLVLGPLANTDAAADACAALAAARRYCRPVAYEGQQLSFAAAAPAGRRSSVASEKKPARRAPASPNP
jgi:hypothetical protein